MFDNKNANTFVYISNNMTTQFWNPNHRDIRFMQSFVCGRQRDKVKLEVAENEHELLMITRLILEVSTSFLSQSIFSKI